MEITGILVKQTAIREGVSKQNGNPWRIAEYLLEVPGQYPRHINFRVSDGQVGRIARFDSLIGKTVTVSFDIDARVRPPVRRRRSWAERAEGSSFRPDGCFCRSW